MKPEYRWSNGKGYLDNQHFTNAINKYGWDNFKHEILFDNLTKDEAENKEIELIAYYDSTNREKGYNISKGGLGSNIFSKETLVKISKPVVQYSKNGKFIKRYYGLGDAAEQNGFKNRSNILLCCAGKTKYAYGYIWRYEGDSVDKYNIEYKSLGKPVIKYDLDGNKIQRYSSAKEAAKENNVAVSAITRACLSKKYLSKNYIWRYEEDALSLDEIKKYKNVRDKRPVLQYSTDGKLIKKYNRMIDAEKDGFLSSTVSVCCKSRTRLGYGYIWRHEGEELLLNEIESYSHIHTNDPVIQYSKDGKFIRRYDNVADAVNKTGYNFSGILGCCKGEYKTSHGYIWKYEWDKLDATEHVNKVKKRVSQYTLNGELIKTYDSMTSAAIDNKLNDWSGISAVCKGRQKTAYGYIWRYADEEE